MTDRKHLGRGFSRRFGIHDDDDDPPAPHVVPLDDDDQDGGDQDGGDGHDAPPPAAATRPPAAMPAEHGAAATVLIPLIDGESRTGIGVLPVVAMRAGMLQWLGHAVGGVLRGRPALAPGALLSACMSQIGFVALTTAVLDTVRPALKPSPLRTPSVWLGWQWWRNTEIVGRSGTRGSPGGTSAGLGLALAMIMAASRCRGRGIVATGELADSPNADGNRRVNPVDGIAEKIAVVLGSYHGEPGAPTPFFMPPTTRDGQDIAALLDAPGEAGGPSLRARLAAGHFVAVPVATVADACGYLGARRLASGRLDKAIILTVACCALSFGAISFRDRPMGLEWLPHLHSPLVRAPSEAALARRPEPMLCSPDGVAAARTGEWIGMPFQIADARFEFGPTAVVAVTYNDRRTGDTPIRVLPAPRNISAGQPPAQFKANVLSNPESFGVTLVAQRWTSAATLAKRLEADLKEQFRVTEAPESGYISKIGNYLHSRFEGRSVSTKFNSIATGGECR